jgi:hypothetical protein
MHFESLGTFVFVEAAMLVFDVYNSYKIDDFDYSCDKFMKFEFFYEK